MRCPRCGFVGFDDQPRCKNCGFDLDAFRRGETIARSSWLDRLRGKPGPADLPPAAPKKGFLKDMQRAQDAAGEAAATRREAERQERGLLAQERDLREEGVRLRRAYAGASAAEQVNIQAKLADLDQARQRLRREMEDFEARKKAHEAELREKLTHEKRAAQAELARAQQMQAEIEQELHGAREARRQAESELQAVAETKERVQAELEAARREQERLDEEARRAREAQERIHAELADARRKAADDAKAEAAEQRERRDAEIRAQAETLIEEAKRQVAEEARRVLERERLQARVLHSSAESDAARRAPGAPAPGEGPALTGAVPGVRPVARPEDVLAVLGRPRERHAPRQTPRPAPDAAAATDDALEEEIIEETDWEEGSPEAEAAAWEDQGPTIVPKGGLIFRTFAALIDLALLLMVVGVFLLIGRMAAGSRIPDLISLLVTLGLPFYVLFVLLATAYFTYMHGAYGQTLGKRLLGVKTLTTHGEELGYLTAFFRFVAACFAVGLLGMGIVWIALDPNKQGWHDKLSRTVVIRL